MPPKREPVYAVGEYTVAQGLKVYFRWHLEGLEHIPRTGPALVASNHISYLDGLSVAFAVNRAGRRPRFLAKASLFKVPVIGVALKAIGQIPVLRGTKDAPQSLDHAEEALRRGEAVVVFIEGTTTTAPDLALGKPKTGTARLALATGYDIIPCATWGGQWVWTKHLGVNLRPRQDVWVRFGPPVSVAAWAGREGDRQAWREVSDAVMERIAGMLGDLRQLKPWAPQAPTKKKFIAEQEAKAAATAAAAVPVEPAPVETAPVEPVPMERVPVEPGPMERVPVEPGPGQPPEPVVGQPAGGQPARGNPS